MELTEDRLNALILRAPLETPSIDQYSDKDKLIIKEIFMLMKATWTHKYVSQFKTPDDVRLAMRVWLQAFAGTNRDILRYAVQRLGHQLEWPPTIRQMHEELRLIQKETAPVPRSLPRPAMSGSAVCRQELEKMKGIVHS